MTRHSGRCLVGSLQSLALLMGLASSARAETPDGVVRQVLQANPVVAPYQVATSLSRNGQVVLSGSVGSKQIHDLAVRLAIATGYPIRDDLVIDTGAAHRVAAAQAQWQLQAQAQAARAAGGSPQPASPSLGLVPGGLPYVYPPPLFGRLDDPFFGFEPPLLSYPPWWGAVIARSRGSAPMPAANPAPIVVPYGTGDPGAGSLPAPSTTTTPTAGQGTGTIEMTIDPNGRAVLRGTVPTLADRIAIGQKIAQTPGVSEVLNLLQVAPTADEPAAAKPGEEVVPPAPQPANDLAPIPQQQQQPQQQPQQPPQGANAGAAPTIVVDGGPLNERLTQAFARRPALAGLPIQVTVREGIATLSGKVPTVYEAMLAYRAVEATPGVRGVIDSLEFEVPDGARQNPLIKQGRPEDVEPYLTAQIRRHVGDLAHIDRVRLLGDTLEYWGTLAHAEDRARLDAILRSMAVLRGFRLEPHVEVD
jgi:hypothetical protein